MGHRTKSTEHIVRSFATKTTESSKKEPCKTVLGWWFGLRGTTGGAGPSEELRVGDVARLANVELICYLTGARHLLRKWDIDGKTGAWAADPEILQK